MDFFNLWALGAGIKSGRAFSLPIRVEMPFSAIMTSDLVIRGEILTNW